MDNSLRANITVTPSCHLTVHGYTHGKHLIIKFFRGIVWDNLKKRSHYCLLPEKIHISLPLPASHPDGNSNLLFLPLGISTDHLWGRYGYSGTAHHVIDVVIQESVLKQKKEYHLSTDWDEKDTFTLLNFIVDSPCNKMIDP